MRAEPESVECEPFMIPDKTTALAADAVSPPVLRALYAPPDEEIAAGLLREAARARDAERRIDVYARRLIEGIRAGIGGVGGIEDFLHEYSLSTKEGLALMVLAEALLRVPDNATADRLIEDKLKAAETPESIVASLVGRLGLPAVRTATRQAMRLLGAHFVLGQNIGEALDR